MIKLLLKGLLLIGLFFGTWFSMRQIDWMRALRLEHYVKSTEEKLGDLLWKTYETSETAYNDFNTTKVCQQIIDTICSKNAIEPSHIKLHILQRDELNAFALPDGHLVIYKGLIDSANCPEELAGVIAHELAHIKLNHVINKLAKEIGLTALISLTSGGKNPEMLQKILNTLAKKAFDRSLEKEADLKAVDYMVNAKIDPRPLGDFLVRISEASESTSSSNVINDWVSTHPASIERARYLKEKIAQVKKSSYLPVITDSLWYEIDGHSIQKNTY